MKRFLLILALVFIVSVVAGGALVLKKGIYIDDLQVGPAKISHSFLQWQQKLNLQIDSVVIDASQKQQENSKLKQFPDSDVVDKAAFFARWLDRLFARVTVTAVESGEIHGTFLYEKSIGQLTLSSPVFDLQAGLRGEDDFLVVDIEKLASEQYHSHAAGEFRFDIVKKRGIGHFTANLSGSLPVLFTLNVDSRQLSFQGKENGVITTIKPFVDLFGLDQSVQPWITEYLTGNRYELKSFKGEFPWDNPPYLFDSFTAEVRVEGCEYTFASGLEPIKTAYTDVKFEHGVLNIYPNSGRFYGQSTEDSWLNINFNDPENIILTAYILTHAVANEDIVTLLKYYGISFPFVQKTGDVGVDLTLAVNLNLLEVNAKARFQIEDGLVEYQKKLYRVQNGVVHLQNCKVTIERMQCSAENFFQVDLSGIINAQACRGDIDVVLEDLKIPVGKSVLALAQSNKKTKVQIQRGMDGFRVNAGESFWKIGSYSLRLGAFSVPVSFDDFSGKLPLTRLTVQKQEEEALLEMDVAGDFSIQEEQADLHCSVQKYSAKDIVLVSHGTPIRIRYNDGLYIDNLEKSLWSINSIPVTLFPASGSFSKNLLSIESEKVLYGDFIEGAIKGSYDFTVSKGEFYIDDPQFRMEQLSKLFNPESSHTLQIDGSGEHLRILVPGLDLVITTGQDMQWFAHFENLKAAHDNSPLLQRFKLNAGELRVALPGPGMPYCFTAEIPYSYPFLVYDGKPMDLYHIRGQISEGEIWAEINSKLSLRYTDKFTISSKDIAYNIPVIFKFMEECLTPEETNASSEEKTVDAVLRATDSGLYLAPDSQLKADTIVLNVLGKKMDMELSIGKGRIVANMEGETFSLSGKDLGDTFMNGLFPSAHVKNGRMEMAAQGEFDDFSLLAKVKDTTLEDFKTLNNILAFVNTIPALVTFSLPNYSSSGLQVTSAMAGMRVEKGLATVESMYLHSPELNMVGKGWVNYPEKKIGMDFNLITQTKKNIQKIPLIGYIFAGEKKQPSIIVKVSGDLMDPEVESGMFQEVVTIPFGILYRTLSLPAYLVSPMFSDEDEQLPESEPKE